MENHCLIFDEQTIYPDVTILIEMEMTNMSDICDNMSNISRTETSDNLSMDICDQLD